MSAADYRCARMDCDETAVAVSISRWALSTRGEQTGLGFYGHCAAHLQGVTGRMPTEWLHEPPACSKCRSFHQEPEDCMAFKPGWHQ